MKKIDESKMNALNQYIPTKSTDKLSELNEQIAEHREELSKSGISQSKRDRKLLIHKLELVKIGSKISQKGLTLVPLKLYFKGALIKMELGLCQGKHTFDKKDSLKEKDIKRLAQREMKNYR